MTSKITLAFLIAFVFFINLAATAVNVTFRVDMSQQSGFTTPEVNGSFNGWCGNCFPMTDADGDNIWEATTNLATGNFEYKFSADNWGSQESLLQGSPCTVTNFGFTNRSLVVTGDVVLPVVCWGACVDCAAAPVFYDITFQVDMNGQTGFTTPELNGVFNGWCGNCTVLQDTDGDGIWSITLSLQEGSYEYKFSYDNWTGQESLTPGSTCTLTTDGFTNRLLTVSQDVVLPAVCWGSCFVCGGQAASFPVSFQVDMQDVLDVTSVEVNGTFNGWCGACFLLDDTDGDGVWSGSTVLDQGTYEYKFTYNGGTEYEQFAGGESCTMTTGEFTNRLLVATEETNLPTVCWGSCQACGVVVLNQMNLPVTFDDASVEYGLLGFDGSEVAAVVVDPTDATNMVARVTKSANAGASSGVTVTAPAELGFSSPIPFEIDSTSMSVRVWSPDAGIQIRLKVEDHTNPTRSVETQVATTMANVWETLVFDFANQAVGTAPINLDFNYDKATIFFNFGVNGATAGEKTYYFDDVAFGEDVVQVIEYAVTFQVDMQNVNAADFSTPEVNGSFNGWCGGCFPLSDEDADGIWTGTAMIPEGVYEYKFAYDGWTGQENLLPGSSCTVTNFEFTNRALEISSDVVLPVVCWESCSDCSTAPTTFDVTFQVDMNGVVGFTTPEVNGTFNNWCGSCFQMSDANGDNVWDATTTLQEGSYEFKFSHDNWLASEQLTSGDPCTVTDGAFVNRLLNVQSDTTLSVVCWASCQPCFAPLPVQVTLNVDLGPAVATSVEVSGTFNEFCLGCAPMTALGNNQYTLTLEVIPGVHYYSFTINNGTQLESLSDDVCTVGSLIGGYLRELVVSEDVNVAMVCWESCAPCAVGVEVLNTDKVHVFPNPANETVRLELQQPWQATFRLLDVTGREVTAGQTQGRTRIDISTQSLSEGVYQLQLTDGTRLVSRQLVIQH